ncbi:unnamed protein product, partial [Rotaria sp. Silwood1]
KYIKLSDFGLSRCEGEKLEANDCIVSALWSAPECFDRTQILSSSSDRFLIEQGRRLSQPERCSESLYDLMYRCWNANIAKRPRFVDIIDELNGTNLRKDSIIPFTHGERKSIQTTSTIEDPYIELDNNEDEDTILL